MENKNIYFAIILILFAVKFSNAQEITNKENPIDAFSSIIGNWYAPDSVIQNNPQMKGRGIFKFEYDEKQSHIKIYEDFSLADANDYAFVGLLSLNPLTGKFEFMGINTDRGFLFKGYFSNVSSTGFTREYDVFYPAESYMAKSFGQVISFREDFIFKNKSTLTFGIKYYNSDTKKWEPWSQNEHVVIKE